ncbi:MAG: UvrD-helicase domain-containing protein [Oscillospiraceae bacterium]
MADFRPTASQQAAIDARGGAVLVSAGAGSGKTRVLTERLMGYICDDAHPVDSDSFLIITFTRAAAAELRGAIHGGSCRAPCRRPRQPPSAPPERAVPPCADWHHPQLLRERPA